MTATDELRRMLDERGVEWRDDSSIYGTRRTVWKVDGVTFVAAEVSGRLKVSGYLTPEQAIAATLGSGTCRYELKDGRYKCSNCGRSTRAFEGKGDPLSPPRFCPDCGAKVVDE